MWQLEKLDISKWDEYWSKIDGATMLQSNQYGRAKKGKFLQHDNYLIVDEDNIPHGIVQLLISKIPFFGGVARINRGPLFFNNIDGAPDVDAVKKTLRAIKKKAMRSRWWYIRFAPELRADFKWDEVLIKSGMVKVKNSNPYGSLLLSLDQSEDDLFTGLKGKWRNLLRKSMSFDLKVLTMNNVENIDDIIDRYSSYQDLKNFSGVPENLIRSLSKQEGEDWSFKIFGAYSNDVDKEPVAILVSVRHGDTSTYLIGMSEDEGRRLNANYLLLWHSILDAKKEGCRYFDLGGLNEDTTKGVAHFKMGTNGVTYKLVGEWHWFIGIGNLVKKILIRGS